MDEKMDIERLNNLPKIYQLASKWQSQGFDPSILPEFLYVTIMLGYSPIAPYGTVRRLGELDRSTQKNSPRMIHHVQFPRSSVSLKALDVICSFVKKRNLTHELQ